jgi:hypothetical protein
VPIFAVGRTRIFLHEIVNGSTPSPAAGARGLPRLAHRTAAALQVAAAAGLRTHGARRGRGRQQGRVSLRVGAVLVQLRQRREGLRDARVNVTVATVVAAAAEFAVVLALATDSHAQFGMRVRACRC